MTTDDLQNWASLLRWVGVGVTILGIIITLGSNFVADRLRIAQAAEKLKAQERLTASEQEVTRSRHDIHALQERQRHRHLTESEKQTIRQSLQSAPRGQIDVIVPINGGEDSLAFADEIRALLAEIGFSSDDTNLAVRTPSAGLTIEVKAAEKPPGIGTALQTALQAAGYVCKLEVNPKLGDDEGVNLVVGSKE